MSFRGEDTRHTHVLSDCAEHFKNTIPVFLVKQWTSKQESSEMDQCQLVGYSIDSDREQQRT